MEVIKRDFNNIVLQSLLFSYLPAYAYAHTFFTAPYKLILQPSLLSRLKFFTKNLD